MQRHYILDVVKHLSKHLSADICHLVALGGWFPFPMGSAPQNCLRVSSHRETAVLDRSNIRTGDSDPGTFAKNSARQA
jgi:hypothetical protein